MEKRIVFLASGRGSNFQVIMEKIKEKQIKANPISLITDNPDAFCLETAKKFNLSSRILSYKNYPKLEFNEKLEELIDKDKPDLIVAAGFMKILPNSIVSKYRYKIINIHPSLLPSFPGLHAQQQAHSYGVKFSGCTTHFVDEGVDTGPIIMQEIVPIVPNMTEEDLTKAILVKEHQIFPKTIQYFCEDKIVVSGRKCNIKI
ncbi:MAG: phosphoribosylglycinamide formyltransferase [Leptospiraceae bacterium]|nr:phosphoribosylglycinamide formyltransferase [Leptospiraceae bacterium]MCP5497591.1 phosphoribosylglycinamide formyltransferase [Leptospiraceae bacterium]